MNDGLRLYRYQLPLTQPLTVRSNRLEAREGLLVEDTASGRWGEAAPLPGFSRETLADVIAAAQQRAWERYPSLQFAWAALHRPWPTRPVPVNALLVGSDDTVVKQAAQLAQTRVQAVKLKVGGGQTPEDEVLRVRRVRAAMRPDQQLRLDANRQWSTRQASQFLYQVRDLSIAYIEEPSCTPGDFESLHAESGVPYALDETLYETTDNLTLRSFPNVAALILKPTLLGAERLCQLLDTKPPKVFSACFESGVGLAKIALLAAESQPTIAAGLDTYRWLKDDLLLPRLVIRDGLFTPSSDASLAVDTARLISIPAIA